QLRQVLSGELRAQAEAFGVVWDGAATTAIWRDTRLWCPTCGQKRLRGTFEPLSTGRINLHLRCPSCGHEINSWGHVPLEGMRSFRAAYKRLMQYTQAYFLPGLLSGAVACVTCGSLQPLDLVRADELPSYQGRAHGYRDQSGLFMVTQCSACRRHHGET